jgi:hypothetical protein
MKKSILIYILFISLNSYCQESYNFECVIHPEKTYSLEMNISSINETTINNETKKSESITNVKRVTTTDKANQEGLFPATMKFGNIKVIGDGKEALNPVSNTIIKGLLAKDNKFKIDTIINPNLDLQTKNALKSVFKELKPDIDFPKKSLKIGDSFEHKIPTNIPLNGEQIKVLITKTFTLKSVTKNIAEFTLTEKITLNMPSENITASGEGNGIVEFNIAENQIVKDISHFTINLNLATQNGNIKGFVKSDSEKITLIE